MSHATTVPVQHAGIAPTAALACPGCRHADHLYAVELIEVVTPATFSLDQPTPADTALRGAWHHRRRHPALALRSRDREPPLRPGRLALQRPDPVIELVDPAPPGSAATTHRPTRGASS